MEQMNVGLVTNKKGVPAMFDIYPGSISDVSTLERTVDRVKQMGRGDYVMVMDRIFGSTSNLDYMLRNVCSFVIPSKKGTKCVKTLMSRLVKQKNEHQGVLYGGLRKIPGTGDPNDMMLKMMGEVVSCYAPLVNFDSI